MIFFCDCNTFIIKCSKCGEVFFRAYNDSRTDINVQKHLAITAKGLHLNYCNNCGKKLEVKENKNG